MKILITRLSAFGDIIHTLPALCALRRHRPEAQIHWLVSKKCRDLLTDHPCINKLHVFERSLNGVLETRKELRKELFDAAIDFQGLIKSASLAWASEAPRRIGFSSRSCREEAAAWFYNERTRPKEDHVILQNMELLEPLGIHDRETDYRIALPPFEAPPIFEKRPIGINVGGGWPSKTYPAEKLGTLAKKITEEMNHPVAVFWGPGEEDSAEAVVKIAPQSVMAPKTSYREMGALLKHCALFVSSESGPLHMAVAVGCPTVCLIGVTDPRRNGPLDPRSRVVLPPPPHVWTYDRKGENPTEKIPVEEVYENVQQLLKDLSS